MREILFRGKRKSDGKWWEGYLTVVFQHTYIEKANENEAFRFVVDPETVGQFTGLTDMNGKKVFEGDILSFTDYAYGYSWIGRVEFGNPNTEYNWGFQLVHIKGAVPNTDILCWFDMEESGAFAEVIGNIHDNPELLEG